MTKKRLNDLWRHKVLIISIDKLRPGFATVPAKENNNTHNTSFIYKVRVKKIKF